MFMDIVSLIWKIHCNVGASTIWKYLEIVCDVSIDRDKLFSKYNKIPSKKLIKIDDLGILRIDKFVKHMWINRSNPHTIGKSSKQINDTCTK
jgi:hypothetical protein